MIFYKFVTFFNINYCVNISSTKNKLLSYETINQSNSFYKEWSRIYCYRSFFSEISIKWKESVPEASLNKPKNT